MEKRININVSQPEAYKAMMGLENYVQSSGLGKTYIDLIKIRASQINGCAYCLDMHTRDALKNGETNRRIFLLNAWKETTLFSEEERTILAMTEEITLIHQGGLSDALYQQAEKYFDREKMAYIIMAIVAINAWNRIGVSTRLQLPNEA